MRIATSPNIAAILKSKGDVNFLMGVINVEINAISKIKARAEREMISL